ncbi:transcription factor SPEECHLESS-like [Aristolochia californica]|uniref:transcription factor SPEECHLESS-like n=1 Tax=Aristolochia californica TaxID=171875 RepID=UPI0035D72735
MSDSLSDFFDDPEFGTSDLAGADSPENLFAILEALERSPEILFTDSVSTLKEIGTAQKRLVSQKSTASSGGQLESETDTETPPSCKKLKFMKTMASSEEVGPDGQQRMSHIAVERNRRKQMNEHLSVLRSLMPCFYVKRGDQASIIGGVVDFIKELQQVLQSLEAKKQRKVYSEVLSPRTVSSPRPSPLSPRLSPLSSTLSLPISPRTPQPVSPYKPRMQQPYLSPTAVAMPSHETPPPSPFDTTVMELAANSKSPVAEVEVKFSGANVLLKTVSQKIPGQVSKIIASLEGLALEILHLSISTVDDAMLNSFTIKIGIECELSAEELAHAVQRTFC